MAADLKWSKDYENDFDAEWYLHNYLSNDADDIEENPFIQFVLDNTHSFFSEVDIKGKRLLDVGSGPAIHTVISAGKQAGQVYLSDYAETNRKILNDWWAGKRDLESCAFKYLIKKENSSESVQERQQNLRLKVKAIYEIDITTEQPLGKVDPCTGYDVITSNTCFESASHTIEEYKKCARNVTTLLKPGGYLSLSGVLNDTFYTVSNMKFRCAKTSEEQLKTIYADLGYDIIRFVAKGRKNDDSLYCDYEGQFAMLAKKKL